VAASNPGFSAGSETAEKNSLEWVTPGHPLHEALRRYVLEVARESMADGACFYSVDVDGQ
jgi:hypothetical protein